MIDAVVADEDKTTRTAVIRRLESIDWNFSGSGTLEHSVHSLHWFPGNFIPELPSFLVQILSRPGDLVLDPFCGSGTTGIEALIQGRRAILSDINRAGLQVAEGKLALLSGKETSSCAVHLAQSLFWDSLLQMQDVSLGGADNNAELLCWFDTHTLAQLRFIFNLINSIGDSQVRSVAHLLFSDTLFACAYTPGSLTTSGKRRRHHWGWIADNVKPRKLVPHNAIALFRERLFRARDVSDLLKFRGGVTGSVHRWDARSLPLADSSVDVVICSPPYLNMIDYARANRLTYLWYGWLLEDDKKNEIGARFARSRKSAAEDYLAQIKTSFGEISRCLKPGGYCAVVIGASRPQGEKFLALFLEKATNGLQLIWGPKRRVSTRRRISDRKGTEPAEYLCVFQRGD